MESFAILKINRDPFYFERDFYMGMREQDFYWSIKEETSCVKITSILLKIMYYPYKLVLNLLAFALSKFQFLNFAITIKQKQE